MYTPSHMTRGVATEIVHTWEPVYGRKEIILTLGKPATPIIINDEQKIAARGRFIDVADIVRLVSRPNISSWSVEVLQVKIGCSHFSQGELKQIVNAYVELNGKK
jgi:hypothetical protein